jgi:hypothetical protein
MPRSVIIRSKAVSSKELARELGVPVSRYKAIAKMVDASLSKTSDKTVVHVAPSPDGWKVSSGGRSKSFATKAAAVAAGRSVARKAKPARLVVHRQNGVIQETFRYSVSAG